MSILASAGGCIIIHVPADETDARADIQRDFHDEQERGEKAEQDDPSDFFFVGSGYLEQSKSVGVQFGGMDALSPTKERYVGATFAADAAPGSATLGTDLAALGGVQGGFRWHKPERFSHFVGLGGAVLIGGDSKGTQTDAHGNEIEVEDNTEAVAAFYPEAGVHYWLTPRVRLTGSAQYWVTTQGRRHDSAYVGLSLCFLTGEGFKQRWVRDEIDFQRQAAADYQGGMFRELAPGAPRSLEPVPRPLGRPISSPPVRTTMAPPEAIRRPPPHGTR